MHIAFFIDVSNVGQGHADLCLPVQTTDRGGVRVSDHGSRTRHRVQSVYSITDQFNLLKSLPIPVKPYTSQQKTGEHK